MTREEAIKILKAIRVYECYPKSASEETKEAIDMAIEALNSVTDSENGAVESKNDVIKRQDAIRWVKTECNPYGKPTLDFESGKKVIEYLEQMPSAEPKTGEWIDIDSYYRMANCSHCLKVTMFEKWGEYTRPYNFCPNCGAKMTKGGDDE